METEVRYCTTDDGVRIACSVTGSGPAVVMASGGLTSFTLTNEIPEWGSFVARMCDGYTRIQYDARGTGLSQRDTGEPSLDGWVRDIEAVVRSANLKRVAIWQMAFAVPSAIAFAAQHPESVRSLVLYSGYVRAREFAPEKETRAVMDLARVSLPMAARVLYGALDTNDPNEASNTEQWVSALLHSITVEHFIALLELLLSADVSAYLPKVQAPALVLHRRGVQITPFAAVQRLATMLPNARFVPLEGTLVDPSLGDSQAVVDAVRPFLAETSGRKKRASKRATATAAMPRGTAVILFIDIADSTAITERMGDAAFRAASRTLDAAVRAAIRDCGGAPVEGKVLGDGVMGVFTSAAQAIDAARRCVELSGESELRLHIGVHAGDVIREEDNVYGGAVNIASRICGLCEPGEILVSATIRDLARTSAGATFEDRGEHALKGIDDSVRLFAVRLTDPNRS